MKRKGRKRIGEKRTGKRNVYAHAIFKRKTLSKQTERLKRSCRLHVRAVAKYSRSRHRRSLRITRIKIRTKSLMAKLIATKVLRKKSFSVPRILCRRKPKILPS